jgi:hypothetical protein
MVANFFLPKRIYDFPRRFQKTNGKANSFSYEISSKAKDLNYFYMRDTHTNFQRGRLKKKKVER